MTKNDEKKSGAIPVRPVCMGIFAAAAATLCLLLLSAALILKEMLGQEPGGVAVIASSFAGAFIGGLTAAKQHGRRAVLCGFAVGIALFCLRTAAALAVGKGAPFGSFAMPLLAALLSGGVLGGLMTGKRRKRRKKRH